MFDTYHLHLSNKKLNQILKLLQMGQEQLTALTTKVDTLETSLGNIRSDIQRIKDSLPASGGLTEAEVATLSTRLDTALGNADALDKENEPEPEPPTE